MVADVTTFEEALTSRTMATTSATSSQNAQTIAQTLRNAARCRCVSTSCLNHERKKPVTATWKGL